MEHVQFITIDDDHDLVVSFAIPYGDLGDVKSFTLLRTPMYEPFLDEQERGVRVSFEDFPQGRVERLVRLTIEGGLVAVATDRGDYMLDITDVEQEEVDACKRVLRKMNRDQCFELKIA
jgi:hypothetical protein